MLQNIILIIIIIILIFFISNEEKMNNLLSKKNYIKYLFLLLICYFIYQKYNFLLLTLIFIFFIIYLGNFQDKIDFDELKKNVIEKMEHFTNTEENKRLQIQQQQQQQQQKPVIEPFKDEIKKIKEMYDSIKNELKKF